MQHFYPDVPRLGNVAVSHHAQAQIEAAGISVDTLLGRATVEASPAMDPIFLRASKADSQTLETVRRVMEALLKDVKVE